jgi:hypothetical protein
MSEVKKISNVDDYYAHIPTAKQEDDASKKSGLKLKIKAKKPTGESDSAIPAQAPSVAVPESSAKVAVRKPAAISFEPAPVVSPRPSAPVSPAPNREFSKGERQSGHMKPASVPLGERLSGSSYVSSPDRPKRPPSPPRISFEQPKPFQPLERRPVAPSHEGSRPPSQFGRTPPTSSGTASTSRPGADRLANYSAKHREDPKKKSYESGKS